MRDVYVPTGDSSTCFSVLPDLAQIMGVFLTSTFFVHPVSLRISANQYRLCVTTNSILPTFLLPLPAKHAAFWPSCVAPCLSLRAYCLLPNPMDGCGISLASTAFLHAVPIEGILHSVTQVTGPCGDLVLIEWHSLRASWLLLFFSQPWLFTFFLHID